MIALEARLLSVPDFNMRKSRFSKYFRSLEDEKTEA